MMMMMMIQYSLSFIVFIHQMTHYHVLLAVLEWNF